METEQETANHPALSTVDPARETNIPEHVEALNNNSAAESIAVDTKDAIMESRTPAEQDTQHPTEQSTDQDVVENSDLSEIVHHERNESKIGTEETNHPKDFNQALADPEQNEGIEESAVEDTIITTAAARDSDTNSRSLALSNSEPQVEPAIYAITDHLQTNETGDGFTVARNVEVYDSIQAAEAEMLFQNVNINAEIIEKPSSGKPSTSHSGQFSLAPNSLGDYPFDQISFTEEENGLKVCCLSPYL